MNRVKIGIVGLSETAIQKHLPVLLKRLDVEIVGAFDPDISKFDKANKALGTNLKFFNSYQDLCFAAEALVICSPESVHLSQVEIAVTEYGLPVIVEESFLANEDKVSEKYQSIYESGDFKILVFCDPEIETADLVAGYESFVDNVFNLRLR